MCAAGSAEYRDASAQYPAELRDTNTESADSDGSEPFWKRAGFSSHGAFLRELRATQELYDPYAQERKARGRIRRAMPQDWATVASLEAEGGET